MQNAYTNKLLNFGLKIMSIEVYGKTTYCACSFDHPYRKTK